VVQAKIIESNGVDLIGERVSKDPVSSQYIL